MQRNLLDKRACGDHFSSLTTFFCNVISAGNVAVGVLGDGDEILDVVRRRCQAVREEEVLEVGVFGRMEASDQSEVSNDGLDKHRAVGEQGN